MSFRRLLAVGWCLLLASAALGQTKPKPAPAATARPPLPANYSEAFHAPLPAALLTGMPDSTKLLTDLQPLAAAAERFDTELLRRYDVRDTTQLAAITEELSIAALVQGHYTDYLRRRRQLVRLMRMPSYRLPPYLPFAAFAVAHQQVPNEAEAAFAPALRKAWREQLDSLPKGFRNDLVNSLKGSYAPGIGIPDRQAMRDILQQIRETGKGQCDYNSGTGLLFYSAMYAMRSRHRATVETLLYEIDPARVVEEKVMVPLRDGAQLSAYVYRDGARPAAERVPAILSLSPYPGGNEAARGNVWATNGYVYVYADTRGRRGSTGTFFPYETDAQDYYDLIDWASKQPWCDGQVATTGGSYLGFAQWQAIRKPYRHPALKAINPMVAVGFGVDFPRETHIFYPYTLQWAQFVSGRDLNQAQFSDSHFWYSVAWRAYKNRVPFVKLDSVAGLPNPFFQKWVSHPDFDAYWRGILPSDEDYQSLDIPALTITGYYDDDQGGALYYYRNHQRLNPKARSNHQLLIGPWDHGGSQWMPAPAVGSMRIERPALVPIYQQVREWFDWRLKGKAKPAWVKDQVTAFAVGTGQWRGAASLEALTRDTLHLYLTPRSTPNPRRKAGLLGLETTAPKAAGTIPYRHDVAQVLDSAFLFGQDKPFGDSLVITSAYNLVFESAPLAQAVEMSGALIPRLFMSLNVPDADFFVTVSEVAPDGKVQLLGRSLQRARYRRGGEKPQLVTPGQVERYDFAGTYLYVKKLAAGTRLRLTFEVSNTPGYERNYGFGGVVARERATGPRLIEATLQTGGKAASRVDLPVSAPLARATATPAPKPRAKAGRHGG